MSVSAANAGGSQAGAALIKMLKTAQNMQVQQVEKLLSVDAKNEIASQKMATAAQILDVYA